MKEDYIAQLQYYGLISRIKRLSDNTLADGRKLYKFIDIGIEPNWFLIFFILEEKKETSISEIANILQFAHPSVITIVKKMKKAGYLKIKGSKSDKRMQIIQLSPKAIKQLSEMHRVWEACNIAVGSLFTDQTFVQELSKMEDALLKESFFDRVINQLEEYQIKIRPFKTQDAPVFASLNEEWLKKYFVIEPIDVTILHNPQPYILDKGGYIFMAEYKGETVGTAALIPRGEDGLELGKMAVNPSFHGKGIGKKLMEFLINFTKENGFSSLFLYSNTKLEPAINLYRKFGFQEIDLEENGIYERSNIKMKLHL